MIKNKILIVDDDKMFAKRLSNMIESLEHDVNTVFSPNEAIEKIKSNNYNVCLVDLFFNGREEGIELVKKMKEISEDTSFIMVTAFGSIQNAIAAVKAGADDYIAKGASGMVNIDQLEMAINNSLKQQRLRKELLLSNKIFESLHSLSLMSSIETDENTCTMFGEKICKLAYEILEVDFVITARLNNAGKLNLCYFYPNISEIDSLDSLLSLLYKEVVSQKKTYVFTSKTSENLNNNFSISGMVAVPINSQDGGILGVIAAGVYSNTSIYPFASKLLQILAQRIAAEITRNMLINERKRIYEQLANAQKIEAVSNLAGGVAHNFNNILCIILANAQLLKEKYDDNKDVVNVVKVIEDACSRGEHLVRQLINTVKVEVGELKPIDINKVVSFVYNLIKVTAANVYELELINDDTEKIVYGDSSQIENALINLCMNSLDALKSGDKLTLSAEKIKISDVKNEDGIPPGIYIKLSVKDTGMGIDEKTLPHIFDPFFTTKVRTNGKGLGLTLVHNTVKEHKGHINVISKQGKGTTFNIFLPEFNPNESVVSDNITDKSIDNKAKKILLVDDDDSLRETLKSVLETNKFNVVEAADGLEACEIYSENNDIDLVILDMIMPKLSGYETYCKLREINPNVKIVIISAYSENEEVAEMLKNNAIAFVHKPFKIKDFLSVINTS